MSTPKLGDRNVQMPNQIGGLTFNNGLFSAANVERIQKGVAYELKKNGIPEAPGEIVWVETDMVLEELHDHVKLMFPYVDAEEVTKRVIKHFVETTVFYINNLKIQSTQHDRSSYEVNFDSTRKRLPRKNSIYYNIS